MRTRELVRLRTLRPTDLPPVRMPDGLEPGNSKTGTSGLYYRTVFVWNLPAAATCPGASEWCLQHCYNGDVRPDVLPVDRWLLNWTWYVHAPEELLRRIVDQIQTAEPPVAVRIHSSGDFYSDAYIRFWLRIARSALDATFWGYTRSWVVKTLLDPLENLRKQSNVELFASWDDTMPSPPAGWRLSVVCNTREDYEYAASDLFCPEQIRAVKNCASCGFCMKPSTGSVVFLPH